ncbi:hypothetical protein [Neptuniibacter caesariensis]|uniref:Uncharacterized protein n=1 Tax=Neptuniibacter caesariensis TaxID=207954 RepID=A0A7U8GRV1_NEPCE|nr:hypothetical protein [Neptuniibacter caesariensis]EAR60520.1 hypothetical protein MED92_16690 [Oceanospirillum sp. MED92] [Neptuniibacter caesariensis]
MYILIGSCRLYQPFLDFSNKREYLINPLGIVSGAPETIQSLNYILGENSIDLNSFSESEIKRYFKKTTNRGRISKLIFGPEVDVSRPTNLSDYNCLVLELSSLKYISLKNHKGIEFYSFMPAEGAKNAGGATSYSELSVEEFKCKLAQISELADSLKWKIIISVPHNLHNIKKRELLREMVIQWAKEKHYGLLDYDEIAKTYFNGVDAEVFLPSEIDSGRYIRHTKKFYRIVSERIDELVREN